MTISGCTRLVGLIGENVQHSLSLRLHNGAFLARGLDWVYLPLPVAAAHVGAAVHGLRGLSFVGANVTMPYKEQVIAHLDALTEDAQQIGAVNTIHNDRGRLVGDNTDARGFLASLQEAGVDPVGQEALVLGAGGAARAIAFALQRSGARLTITNRHRSRAEALAEALPSGALPSGVRVVDWPARGDVSASLLVNCTSVGMTTTIGQSPWPGALLAEQAVVDLIYAPRETALLAQARAAGARAVGGLGMLIHQAALSFARWTGQSPPIDEMRATMENRDV